MNVVSGCFGALTAQASWVASHGVAIEFDSVGGLHKPVQYGIGYRGIRHGLVPVCDGQLACGDRGAFLDPVIQQLEEILLLRLRQVVEPSGNMMKRP